MKIKPTLKLFIAFLFVNGIINAQETQHVKQDRLKNFFAAPVFGYEIFNLKSNQSVYNSYNTTYTSKFSYRTGIDFTYSKSEKLQFNGAILFTKKSFERLEVNNESQSAYYYKSINNFKYIELQAGSVYTFYNSRFDVGCYGNISFSYLLKAFENRTTETGNTFVFNIKDKSNNIVTAFEPGLYFNYNLTYRLSLGLKTGYRIYFNSLIVDNNFKNNAVNLQPCLYYKF